MRAGGARRAGWVFFEIRWADGLEVETVDVGDRLVVVFIGAKEIQARVRRVEQVVERVGGRERGNGLPSRSAWTVSWSTRNRALGVMRIGLRPRPVVVPARSG